MGNVEGTVTIKEGSSVVYTDSEAPFQGNFSDWDYSHDYTLVVTVSGITTEVRAVQL